MPARQQFLFAPERPLVERLGVEFFRSIPTSAGVYKMRDAADPIIYIGKARNLRQRLRSYRVANPETLSRWHLRLLQRVVRIELELCEDEIAALKHEAAQIRLHRPKFNRAGVWPGKPQFIAWRIFGNAIQMHVCETPPQDFEAFGPMRSNALRIQNALLQLLWCAANPSKPVADLPCGWIHNNIPDVVTVVSERIHELGKTVRNVLTTDTPNFDALNAMLVSRCTFDTNAIARDLEFLQEWTARRTPDQAPGVRPT
jgi:excinuclease UvrABC nuclease subunit